MSDNVYMQWVEAHFANIRTALIVVTTLLTIVGLIASFGDHWLVSTAAWTSAFLCKWVECWLLERALVEAQLELEAS